MKKFFIIFLLSVSLLLCLSAKNMNIYPNSEIDEETKDIVELLSDDIGSTVAFDKYKSYMSAEKIFVFQVLYSDVALVYVANKPYEYIDGYSDRYDNLALLIDEDEYFYDGMEIDVGEKEELKRIGSCRYKTKGDDYKVVPIIKIVSGGKK